MPQPSNTRRFRARMPETRTASSSPTRRRTDLALVVFGAALMHALITAPDGLAGQLLGLRRRKQGTQP